MAKRTDNPGNLPAVQAAAARAMTIPGQPEIIDVSDYMMVQIGGGATGDGSGVDPAEIGQALIENLGGSTLNAFDFDRVKVPAGGGLSWKLTDPETGAAKSADSLDGVIIHWRDVKSYWPKAYGEAGADKGPPICSSPDAVKGIGEPGILCADCPHNKFGSRGRGKACKDGRLLFVMRPGSIFPTLLIAPATSIGNVKNYFMRLSGKGVPYWKAITRFNLAPDTNADKIEFAKISPEVVGRIGPEQAGAVAVFREMLVKFLGATPIAVSASEIDPAGGDRPEGNYRAEPDAGKPAGDDGDRSKDI